MKELDRFDEMIGNAEQIVVALEEQMTSMDPRLLSILYPQDYIWVDEEPKEAEPEVDAKDEKDDDVPWKDELRAAEVPSPDATKKARKTAKEKRQSLVKKVDGNQTSRRKGPRAPNSVFPDPPERGELTKVSNQMALAMRVQDNKTNVRIIDDLEDMGLPRGQAIDDFWTRPLVQHM